MVMEVLDSLIYNERHVAAAAQYSREYSDTIAYSECALHEKLFINNR